ncbi:52 kDa repressor of the inhibitor of the protein kinase-like [Xenia sp. Carnegie-2017]|uniref:52 kDa repressor of the inhibitor of the protein kinase-like n=1 Tax=Xenia sp. Carnegie-2017 TaxID=2897299 RepID=UPI001F04848C|nr:52 kDa repressor of the inhibitor of the protein kinase-like [Xenia sp. Carnegie-2017]
MTTKVHPYGISHSSALGSCDASSFISSSTLQLPDNKTANADLPRNPYDVGFYREKVRGMEIHEIEKLVKNVFVPDECYEFPKTVDANGRSFPPIFFSEPLTHWPDAKSAIKRLISTSSGLHVHTSALLKDILDQSSGKSQPINVMIDSNLKKKISENRKKLVPVVDTIILAGRLQLPLRGHREDSRYHPEVGEYSEKHVGNFIELLNFRVRAGDTILDSHLKHHDKKASYISKTTQNELIRCCGQFITEQLLVDVKKSTFYALIADETCDISNKEQMSLVLRFVDEELNIREEFFRFIHCSEGMSGKDLASVILKCLNEELNLNIQDCRGQGYDGAGAVAGCINGLAARIKNLNEKAIYTHCFSHRLNLSICGTCAVQYVRNVLEHVKEAANFFNSAELREMHWRALSRFCKKRLKSACKTRWVKRITSLDTFEELYVAIVFSLEEMSFNVEGKCNRETSSKASPLLHLLTSFDFIAALVITRCIFDLTLPVTQLLQSSSNDIADGLNLIEALKKLSRTVRNEVDVYHANWYSIALTMAEKVGVEEKKPRTCGRQAIRSNVPSESVSDYFKKTIADHLCSELEKRFDSSATSIYYGLFLIPSKLLLCLSCGVSWKEKFYSFSSLFLDDLPNPKALDCELDLWQKYWESSSTTCLTENVSSTLKSVNFPGFENIKVLLKILGEWRGRSLLCED